jgi:hypothetical protein
VWDSVEVASIQSTINQADSYFAHPATIKYGLESLLRGYMCAFYIGKMLVACYRRPEVNCVEIYASKEN